MKILHIIPSIDPELGGPAEGLRQWGIKATALGHTVEVVSLDAPGLPFLESFPLKAYPLGPSHGGGYRYNSKLVPWLKAHAAPYDAIIVNGIWQYHSFGAWRALRRMGKPYYVFTHGMLDPWFRVHYPLKHLKKWLYWPWADYRVLRDATAVLFTSEAERLAARESFWLYRASEQVVAYGTGTPAQNKQQCVAAFETQFPTLRNKPFLLFLGRIHEKKGCDLLVRAFIDHAAANPDAHLVMAGPDQTGWVGTLKETAAAGGVSERITWTGMLRGDLKWGAFHSCEAFVLPSHQENFGIAVAEAMGCGKPVLISNKVNIWREIEQDGAGIVADDTQTGAKQLLEDWYALLPAARQTMGHNAARSFQRRFTVEAMTDGLIALFRDQQQARGALAVVRDS